MYMDWIIQLISLFLIVILFLYNLFGIRRKADASTFFNFRGIIV